METNREKEEKRKIANALLQELSDRGQIIEGGWKGYELLVGLKDAPEVQRIECRKAFFFGAQHLFASVLGMLDSGAKTTNQDLERMTKLDAELKKFIQEIT
jgi:hypothetical protein